MARKSKPRSKRKPERKTKSPKAAKAAAADAVATPAAAEDRLDAPASKATAAGAQPELELFVPAPVPEQATPAREESAPVDHSAEAMSELRLLRAGDLFAGRFELKRLLGKGSMGFIWLAHDRESDASVALKVLIPIFAADETRLEALRASVTTAGKLVHPHILRVHGLAEDTERKLVAVAMEQAAGSVETLRSNRPQGWFEPEEITGWIRELCSALEYAHGAEGAVHRDLKPANLLLDEVGKLKLADFGIPLLPDERLLHISSTETSGAPAFMSPQQMRGEAPEAADDLYALGATLYTLLARKPPFLAATTAFQLHQVMHELPLSIAARRREATECSEPVPEQWEETIAALLSRDATARPPLSEIIQRLCPDEVPAPPTSAPDSKDDSPSPPVPIADETAAGAATTAATTPTASKPPPRNWTPSLFMAAILAAAIAAGLWLGREQSRTPRASGVAEASRATLALPPPQSPAPPTPGAATSPVAVPPSRPLGPFTNTLGMRFVGLYGTNIRVCIWPTRVRDFATFAEAVKLKSRSWEDPGFLQTPDHPVVNVSWEEAVAFCKWLTRTEQEQGELRRDQRYRLLTDLEWSRAVGLGPEAGDTPEQRDMGVPDVYPWGDAWPPPVGAGNYSGQETDSETAIKNYEDEFPFTSPVGSFPPNRFGLYDMGGNVWQWVADDWNRESKAKTARGASWYNGALKLSLLSSCRVHAAPDAIRDNYGFRIALEDGVVK